ncbi:DUF1254 domain-containing protein [Colwellia demingiae]|nr:DUF1254 domain-containing protein [Colwellia demingiae]
MNETIKYSMAAIVVIASLAGIAKTAIDEIKLAASAYLYGYPLVIMEETRKGLTAHGGMNQLKHTQDFPDSDFRLVVRPNVDTLYTSAWIDLSQGPLILSMPATGERYYVLPFMDAWTNVFERRGTSTTGNEAQEIAVVGPDFTGELPSGIDSVVKSPTDMVWMIGRIQSNSKFDVVNVANIQADMALTPLALWKTGERYKGVTNSLSEDKSIDPMKIVDAMDAQTFFSKMNTLMEQQSPASVDSDELAKFAHLNIVAGANFQKDNLGFIQQWAVEKALPLTIEKLLQAVGIREANEQGWNVMLDLGTYGTNYKLRAAIARLGLGALPAIEASYPSTSVDATGHAYDGSNNYVLHFPAENIPSVRAFWSLSMYDHEGFFIDNYINRYAIGDRSGLEFNADGSLDLYIQNQPPSQGTSNWLPAPADKFNLLLRLYMVDEAFLKGEWTLPPVRKVENKSDSLKAV